MTIVACSVIEDELEVVVNTSPGRWNRLILIVKVQFKEVY